MGISMTERVYIRGGIIKLTTRKPFTSVELIVSIVKCCSNNEIVGVQAMLKIYWISDTSIGDIIVWSEI